MKFKSNTGKYLVLAFVCVTALAGCGKGDEKDFAEELAKRICVIMNEDKGRERARSPFEGITYLDPDHELTLELEPGGLLTFLDPSQSGTVGFNDYESALGELKGNLAWTLRANMPSGERVSASTTQELMGVLVDDNDNKIQVEITFDVESEADGDKRSFDISSIDIKRGSVQVGDDDPVKL
ncbi:hypothetical protein DYBT9275_02809 [Dyadobacter sp. CECT 9275]|uniref:Lipoprotein n=1 Tax=Dyadobacter helix TaxID=2822344 RepID=A0A916N4S3_9BACT|nr:hypothetical protein [Dyadobacter sp. CECT 9275]CAG5002105.1 hypothetical protein DYBT9275_02809 [Dyadobacter sp. CECT 9275]